MSKPVPPIFKYMTTSPHTVDEKDSIANAAKKMAEHRIRHLPVMSGSKVVGLLSLRDINVIETLQGVDPKTVTVDAAMATQPYQTDAMTPGHRGGVDDGRAQVRLGDRGPEQRSGGHVHHGRRVPRARRGVRDAPQVMPS
jgi:hypothetical protein